MLSSMTGTNKITQVFPALTLVGALLLAGCGSSSSDGEKDTTTTEAAAPDETTTTADQADDTTTTTEAGDEPTDGPSADDLEALLPTAADLGDGWSDDPADESDDADTTFGDAVTEQCPAAAALIDPDKTDNPRAAFTDEAGAGLSVSLSPDAEEADVDAVVAEITACEPVVIEDEDGTVTTLTLEAATTQDYGDQGLQLRAEASITHPDLAAPLVINNYLLLFRTGTVGVRINGTDGYAEDNVTAVPIDGDLLVAVADDLNTEVADLVG